MADIYLDVIKKLNRKRVSYVVIGVSGINYYASDAHDLIMTADFDVFLKPDVGNVTRALSVLSDEGFTMSTKGGLVDLKDEAALKGLVDNRRSIVCTDPYGVLIDLCLDVSGFTYEGLEKNVKLFKVGRSQVRVGRLRDLLRMKEIAARPKDISFLDRYRIRLEELAKEED